MNLTVVAPFLQKQGVYGPVTATLDWCEINHHFSPYIAEMANTFSNLFTIALATFGVAMTLREKMPRRYSLGYLGVALVGVGSFLFHSTLLFEAQLADELPMVYVAGMSLWQLFDTKPGFGFESTRTKALTALLISFDVLFSLSYVAYRNPTYHQVVFAILVLSNAVRLMYLLHMTEAGKKIPSKTRLIISNSFTTGAGLFAFGFFVWNMDNIFCHKLTEWKISVGWPSAFLLEGHSWWHVLTGLGTYFMALGVQYASLSIKETSQSFAITQSFGIPYLKRVHTKVQ